MIQATLVFLVVIWLIGGPLFWVPFLAIPVMLLSGLAACGQKGPLYLPPPKSPETTPKPANNAPVAPARLPDATSR